MTDTVRVGASIQDAPVTGSVLVAKRTTWQVRCFHHDCVQHGEDAGGGRLIVGDGDLEYASRQATLHRVKHAQDLLQEIALGAR